MCEYMIVFFTLFIVLLYLPLFLCFFKLYLIRVTASASLDPEASLSVLSHNTLHLSYNDTVYMRLKKFLNK